MFERLGPAVSLNYLGREMALDQPPNGSVIGRALADVQDFFHDAYSPSLSIANK